MQVSDKPAASVRDGQNQFPYYYFKLSGGLENEEMVVFGNALSGLSLDCPV